MAQRRVTLLSGLVAFAMFGCATLEKKVEAAQRSNHLAASRNGGGAHEKLYEVSWWSKVVEDKGIPYKPIEPSAPEIDPASGTVYVATSDGKVHALNKAGEYLWDYDAGGPFNAGPLLSDGKLFVGTSEGKIVALNAYSGDKLWEYRTGDELVTRPVLGEGLIFVVSAADTLYAVDAATGAWKWQYRRDFTGDFSIRGAARPLVLDGKVFAGFADGYAVSLDVKDGGVLWAKPLGPTGGQFLDVDADPVGDDFGARVFFACYATGVYALDAQTGNTTWSTNTPGITTLRFDGAGGRLFAGGSSRLLALNAERGLQIWQLALGARYVSGLTLSNGLLMVPTGSGPMIFVDASTGQPRRTFNPGKGVAAPAVISPTHDAVVLSNRGYVYNLAIVGKGRK